MKFTIFTGCYNSEPFIQRVFDSLLNQTYQNFEWIAIDDCSKDNTVAVVKKFIQDHPNLDIKLIANEKNGGVAVNRRKAIEMASGDLFVTWDHDDIQKPNQLQRFNDAWTQHATDKVANIFCPCENEKGKLYGIPFPGDITIGNYLVDYKQYFMGGKMVQEKQVCTSVKILRQYCKTIFPESEIPRDGEILWGLIASHYDAIFLNEPLRVYFTAPQNHVSMSNVTRTKFANETYIVKLIWVNHFLQKMKGDPKLKLRILFAATFYGFLSKRSFGSIFTSVKPVLYKLLVLLLALPTKAIILLMKWRGKGL